MEIFTSFSLADFLAYLFPGMLSLSGLYVILLLTPLKYLIYPPKGDLGLWLFLLGISYIIGVLFANVTEYMLRIRPEDKRSDKIKGEIQIDDDKVRREIELAYIDHFRDQQQDDFHQGVTETNKESESKKNHGFQWNKSHYYVVRSLVTEKMPLAASSGIREGAYRQLCMNLIGSVFIFGVAGISWGIWFISQNTTQYYLYYLLKHNITIDNWVGYGLIFGSVVAAGLLIGSLIILMDGHEKREVREFLTAFLAGYKTGVFKKT